MNAVPTMLTLRQAETTTGLSYEQLRRWANRGQVVSVRAGTRILINYDDLIRYLTTGIPASETTAQKKEES